MLPASIAASTASPSMVEPAHAACRTFNRSSASKPGARRDSSAQTWRSSRQPGIQRQTVQDQIGRVGRRLAALEADTAGDRRVIHATGQLLQRYLAAANRHVRRQLRPLQHPVRQAGEQARRQHSRQCCIQPTQRRPQHRRFEPSIPLEVCKRRISPGQRRPLRCNLPSPGSDALASRNDRSLPTRSNAARTCSRVLPPSGAASAVRSNPIGISNPAIVVPACSSTGSQASRSSRLAESAMSSRWRGATRSASAPLAGDPPISRASSSSAARPLLTVRRPSARNGTGGAGSSTARLGPRLASAAGERAVRGQLAGEAGTEPVGLALTVQCHVQPGRAVGSRRSEPRGEVPGLAAELRRSGRGQRTGLQRRESCSRYR